ncbi:MAG: hypothetical protein GTO22_24175 [Gemmatimonadales bacterium]|nr:hypothetical protein [Gemmatimonadales bacterium]
MPTLHPRSDYSEFNLEPTPPSAVVVDSNPFVDDVPQAFARLAAHGDLLAGGDSGVFDGDRAYRYTSLNQRGLNAGVNHLQGMQRLRRGQYVIVSAGDSTEPMSHLFVVRMGTRRAQGPWGSNLLHTGVPPDEDGFVRVIALDRDRWHAGGLGLTGEILAVPLEGGGRSRVIFLDVRDPENPTCFPANIERPGFPKAGAVALAKLPDGRFVCIVWREEGGEKPVGRFDFYLSHNDRFFDGFQAEALTLRFPGLRAGTNRDPQYQTIVLLSPRDVGGGAVVMHLIGCENESALSPFGNGANLADLFELRLHPDMLGNAPNGQMPSLEHLDTREFHAPREYCNLDAASGLYLAEGDAGPEGTGSVQLALYGAYHWRVDRTIRFAEFRARPDPASVVTDLADAWVDLYEHDKFRGRRLSVYGTDEAAIANYREIYVQDGDFNERVSSVRYHIPNGWRYRLYREPDFAGTRANRDYLDLRGTGVAEEIANLKRRKFGDAVSSSRFVQSGA